MDYTEVTRAGLMDCQVCVPAHFSDEQVLIYASLANPAGTSRGWSIRKQGHPMLSGADERVKCERHPENVHIMLEC